MRTRRVLSLVAVAFLLAGGVAAQWPRNYEGPPRGGVSVASVITIIDSGWSTLSFANDCVTGWSDDTWNLRLSASRNVTLSVTDCCCSGDYYEVYVDGRLIGTTFKPSTWGCSTTGFVSSGTFTVSLCPGDHEIKVRDAGFDGHTFDEITQENMCPAGFQLSGTLSPPAAAAVTAVAEARIHVDAPEASEKALELDSLLTEAAPYLHVDGNGMERLRVSEARKAGVSEEAIGTTMKLIAIENRLITAARRGEQAGVTPADFAFIQPLYLQVALADPCGTQKNPSPCPPPVDSGQFFATRTEVVNYLLGLGYHETARYATKQPGDDFTLVVSSACGGSAFREQAIVHPQGQCWTYSRRGPEPNPETQDYAWPRSGWVGYVRWWHQVYCP